MRPCLVKGAPATFHMWEQRSFVTKPDIFIGGFPGGQVAQVLAIIEHADGTVSLEYPCSVQFTDKEETEDV